MSNDTTKTQHDNDDDGQDVVALATAIGIKGFVQSRTTAAEPTRVQELKSSGNADDCEAAAVIALAAKVGIRGFCNDNSEPPQAA